VKREDILNIKNEPMKSICTIILAFLYPLCFYAQEENISEAESSNGRAILSIIPELEIGFPIGEFKNQIDKGVMLGKGVSIFYRLKKMPIDLGLRFGDFSYDHVRRKFDGKVQKTKCKIWNWYGAFRFEPQIKFPVQPYFEGSLGVNRFYTKTYTKQIGAYFLSVLFDEDIDVRFDKASLNSDWGMTYGSAIGFYYYFDKEYNSALDVQVGFRTSNAGRFYIKNDRSIIQEEPLDNYEERNGAMSMISLKIGLSLFIVPQ